MYQYSIMQWVLFFYIYSFLGWIWETLYVSVGSGRWVNRGFMHGPFLPIYGFGFTGMVFATIPFQGNYLYEFVIGIIGATIMEYITGYVMEKLFHLRYWDYSDNRFNLNGYICLKASLCWGVFAIIGPEILHSRVEKLVMAMPFACLQIVVLLLTAYVAADFSESFREALDFKEILMNLTQSNRELAKIERRVAVLSEFVNGELKEKSEAGLKKINSTLTDSMQICHKKAEELIEIKDKITDSLEKLKWLPEEGKDNELEKKKGLREELEIYLDRMSKEEHKRLWYRNKSSVNRSFRILKRNPNLISKDYSEALSAFRELEECKKTEKDDEI